MHHSVIEFLRSSLVQEEISGKTVLEVGSRIVHGSARDIILPMRPASYVGTDLMDGKGVDVVIKAESLSSRFSGVDVVICVEVLEHVEFWQAATMEMKRILRPGGIMIVTTRSPGFPYHPHPSDFWRFTVADVERAFSDFEILSISADPQEGHPGVFLKGRRPAAFSQVDISTMFVQPVG